MPYCFFADDLLQYQLSDEEKKTNFLSLFSWTIWTLHRIKGSFSSMPMQ